LILQELRNLLPSSMFILSITLPNLSIPDMPFPTLTNSLQERFQVKPATLPIPIDEFLILLLKEFYGTRTKKWLFSLIYVGSGEWFFTACAVCSFFSLSHNFSLITQICALVRAAHANLKCTAHCTQHCPLASVNMKHVHNLYITNRPTF